MSARVAIVLGVVLLASVASAGEIGKWTTPDGGTYYGDNPPAGSTPAGEIGGHVSYATQPVVQPEAPGAAEPGDLLAERREARAAEREARREARIRANLPAQLRASGAVAIGGAEQRSDSYRGVLTGSVINGHEEPIYHVRVCDTYSDRCWRTTPRVIQPGGHGTFGVEVTGRYRLEPRFSVDP